MKLKRSRFTSVFLLISFFVSFGANICCASLISSPNSITTQTKDHLHLSEGVVNVNINDILFEENENEDEKEFELDLFSSIIPFFLQTFFPTTSNDLYQDLSASITHIDQPIYIQVSNIRI